MRVVKTNTTSGTQHKLKVAVITCYFLPDYVRSLSIRAALARMTDVETVVIKNSYSGIFRYPQVIAKLIWCRIVTRPNIYILGFRGQEILPVCLLLTTGKPLIFDEFIVPLAWANRENHVATIRVRWLRFLSRISAPLYRLWLKTCNLILTDTHTHAELSAGLSGLPLSHYRVLPVGTDESLFKPILHTTQRKDFLVFFYGLKMTPLHGLNHILEAAVLLARDVPQVTFQIVGGDAATKAQIDAARQKGARIRYTQFVPFNKLAQMMQQSDLCLGGPFGDTDQARSVITGKTYQSIACARPTIVADSLAYSNFTDWTDCLKVALGNGLLLAHKIQWAYSNRDMLPAIGQKGRKLYETSFSTVQIAEQLHSIITEVV
jgi:glycosyltransferase involved in cell wall biosynthesis